MSKLRKTIRFFFFLEWVKVVLLTKQQMSLDSENLSFVMLGIVYFKPKMKQPHQKAINSIFSFSQRHHQVFALSKNFRCNFEWFVFGVKIFSSFSFYKFECFVFIQKTLIAVQSLKCELAIYVYENRTQCLTSNHLLMFTVQRQQFSILYWCHLHCVNYVFRLSYALVWPTEN